MIKPSVHERDSTQFGRLSLLLTDARKSIDSLDHVLGARALHDASEAKSMFVDSAPARRLIHVHIQSTEYSHVPWNEADALMYRVDFSNSDRAYTVGKLTARAIVHVPNQRQPCSPYCMLLFVLALLRFGGVR